MTKVMGIRDADEVQVLPYNLLVTRRWLMVIPRRREHVAGLSINALGFAGTLLAGDDRQMRALRAIGPIAALRSVAMEPAGAP
jgi:ATP adenylyltransferase